MGLSRILFGFFAFAGFGEPDLVVESSTTVDLLLCCSSCIGCDGGITEKD